MDPILTRIEPYYAPMFLYQDVINDEQCEFLRNFCSEQKFLPSIPGNDNSLNYSDNQDILSELPDLKEYFESLIQSLSKNVIKQVTEAFAIKQSWATRSKKGGASSYHQHRNYYMAGVLYLQDDNQIVVENPWQSLSSFAFESTEHTAYNCLNSVVTIPNKSIILMPAYLKHQVPPWSGDNTRYSIAMNIHPIGTYGVTSAFITV
jgi:hypothetical protein